MLKYLCNHSFDFKIIFHSDQPICERCDRRPISSSSFTLTTACICLQDLLCIAHAKFVFLVVVKFIIFCCLSVYRLNNLLVTMLSLAE